MIALPFIVIAQRSASDNRLDKQHRFEHSHSFVRGMHDTPNANVGRKKEKIDLNSVSHEQTGVINEPSDQFPKPRSMFFLFAALNNRL